MFNEKTVQYWVNKFPGLTAEIVQELSEDINERLTRKKKFSESFADYIPLTLDLQERFTNYDTVVQNTLRKFPYLPGLDVIRYRATTSFAGVERNGERLNVSELENFTLKQTDTIVFYQAKPNEAPHRYYREVKVPAILLWNDPVAVAQYTRKAIRAEQAKVAQESVKNAVSVVQQAERELREAEAKLKKVNEAKEKAEALRDSYPQKREQWLKKKEARLAFRNQTS